MATTIYNGLLYTTKEINRNFRIKINGIVDGKKVNKLVGVKGLIELIRRTVRPVVKECYKNAHLLTLLFPDRVQYVEGKTNVFIPIDHAFNRVGNKYIDITFEFALGLDPTQYEYVAFGEYPAGVIEEIANKTGYYGDIYRFCYCAAQMALEKMNPRT